MLGKQMYMKITNDKEMGDKIDMEIAELKRGKQTLNHAKKIIKNYNSNIGEPKKVEKTGNRVKSLNIDLKNMPITLIVRIRKHLEKFCMDGGGRKKSGEIEYHGTYNVLTNKITWTKFRTVSGFNNKFYTKEQREKCEWVKNKQSADFNKRFLEMRRNGTNRV